MLEVFLPYRISAMTASTHAGPFLSYVESIFNIQSSDTGGRAIVKFSGGTLTKIFACAIAASEALLAETGSFILRGGVQSLTEYATAASQVLADSIRSLDRPFALAEKKTSSCCGFYQKIEHIEGPTISSHIRPHLERTKIMISEVVSSKDHRIVGLIFAASAIMLYWFGSSVFENVDKKPMPMMNSNLTSMHILPIQQSSFLVGLTLGIAAATIVVGLVLGTKTGLNRQRGLNAVFDDPNTPVNLAIARCFVRNGGTIDANGDEVIQELEKISPGCMNPELDLRSFFSNWGGRLTWRSS